MRKPLLVVAVALAMLLAGCSGGAKPKATATAPSFAASPTTPTETVAPAPTVSASLTATPVALRALNKVADVPFSAAYSLVFATCAYGHGHGGCFLVERVYRDPSGQLRRESLFDPSKYGTGANITGIEADEGGVLFLTLCLGSQCPYEGYPKDVRTQLLVSHDGGVTWSKESELDGEWWVRVASGGSALAVNFAGPAPQWKQLPANIDAVAPSEVGLFANLHLPAGFDPRVQLDASRLIATVEYERPGTCTAGGMTAGADPAVIDLDAGTYAFIHDPFYDPACSHGTQRVISLQRAPFARVKTGSDCLNVRETPAQASLSLGCFKDGVLLRVRGQAEQTAEGITWVAVETPDGRSGWASGEFLER